jgi:hypothetical protein
VCAGVEHKHQRLRCDAPAAELVAPVLAPRVLHHPVVRGVPAHDHHGVQLFEIDHGEIRQQVVRPGGRVAADHVRHGAQQGPEKHERRLDFELRVQDAVGDARRALPAVLPLQVAWPSEFGDRVPHVPDAVLNHGHGASEGDPLLARPVGAVKHPVGRRDEVLALVQAGVHRHKRRDRERSTGAAPFLRQGGPEDPAVRGGWDGRKARREGLEARESEEQRAGPGFK